jgi:hypothetical protein
MATAPPLSQIPLVLDTDVFTAWRYQEEAVKQNIFDYERFHKRFPALASITVFEVLIGYEKTIAQRGNGWTNREGPRRGATFDSALSFATVWAIRVRRVTLR